MDVGGIKAEHVNAMAAKSAIDNDTVKGVAAWASTRAEI